MNKLTIPERDFSLLRVPFCTVNSNWAFDFIMVEKSLA